MNKKVIKLTTPWGQSFLNDRISTLEQNSSYIFEIDNDCDYCDYWVVWGGFGENHKKNRVKTSKTIFLTDEVHKFKIYNKKFIDQFDAVITPRKDIKHSKVIPSHELNTWHILKTYDELIELNELPKSKKISVVSSDLTDLSGHKLRYALVNKLIGHFKDRLDVYGRGFNPIDNKWDALAPYKYSIAIENNSFPGYFTEKLSECYLSLAMPVYYGCPDIENFFDSNSMLIIDIYDYQYTIKQIEQLLEEDPYQQKLPLLVKQKNKYLENYNIFNALPKILTKEFEEAGKPEDNRYVRLHPQNNFLKYQIIRKVKNRIFNNFKK